MAKQQRMDQAQPMRAANFATKFAISTSLVHSYANQGLLTPEHNGKYRIYGEREVWHMQLITRLRADPFRFQLADIRKRILPKFSLAKRTELAKLSNKELRTILERKGIQ